MEIHVATGRYGIRARGRTVWRSAPRLRRYGILRCGPHGAEGCVSACAVWESAQVIRWYGHLHRGPNSMEISVEVYTVWKPMVGLHGSLKAEPFAHPGGYGKWRLQSAKAPKGMGSGDASWWELKACVCKAPKVWKLATPAAGYGHWRLQRAGRYAYW